MTDGSAEPGQDAETRRVASLMSLGLLGTAPEERFDRITRAASELFQVPIAAVNLLDDQHLFAKAPQVAGATVWDRKSTFCDVTIREDELLVVPDATADERFSWKPDVAGGRGVRFYAGRPLRVDGQPVGTLCLYDTEPRELNEEDRARLDAMGAWAERELLDSRDVERAVQVQHALLPTHNPAAPFYAVAGFNLPLKGLGGDFYTWRLSPEGLDLTLADVMGKGLAAALMAATIRAAINSVPAAGPAERLDAAAETLRADLEATGIFATVFHARLDLTTGELVYSDAGHGLTLVIRADGSHERLSGSGLPLGLEFALGREDRQAVLAPGDTLVSFTDGLLDLYGGTHSALEAIAAVIAAHREPQSILLAVQALVDAAAPDDDITVVAVYRPPA